MNDYNLRELQEKVELYKALERRKASLAGQKQELFSEECRLAVLRDKEDADVEKWEGGSLAAFFYGVVGKREERLEKEKQEAYEAAVKHDAVKAELAAVEAFSDREGNPTRPDILQALNRMSSMLYILMIRRKKET